MLADYWPVLVAIAILLLFVLPVSGGSRRSSGPSMRERRRLADQADELIKKSVLASDDVKLANLPQALNLALRAGDGLLASEACSYLGDALMNKKRYAEAAGVFDRALSYREHPGWYAEKPEFVKLLQRRLLEARENQSNTGRK